MSYNDKLEDYVDLKSLELENEYSKDFVEKFKVEARKLLQEEITTESDYRDIYAKIIDLYMDFVVNIRKQTKKEKICEMLKQAESIAEKIDTRYYDDLRTRIESERELKREDIDIERLREVASHNPEMKRHGLVEMVDDLKKNQKLQVAIFDNDELRRSMHYSQQEVRNIEIDNLKKLIFSILRDRENKSDDERMKLYLDKLRNESDVSCKTIILELESEEFYKRYLDEKRREKKQEKIDEQTQMEIQKQKDELREEGTNKKQVEKLKKINDDYLKLVDFLDSKTSILKDYFIGGMDSYLTSNQCTIVNSIVDEYNSLQKKTKQFLMTSKKRFIIKKQLDQLGRIIDLLKALFTRYNIMLLVEKILGEIKKNDYVISLASEVDVSIDSISDKINSLENDYNQDVKYKSEKYVSCIKCYAANKYDSMLPVITEFISDDKKKIVELMGEFKKQKLLSDEQIFELNNCLSKVKMTSVPTYYNKILLRSLSYSHDSSCNVDIFIKDAKLYMYLDYCKRCREILIDISKKYKKKEENSELDTMFNDVEFDKNNSKKR